MQHTNTITKIQKVSHLLEGRNVLQQELDYANIALDGNDAKLFIDPVLIYGDQQRNKFAERCWIVLEDYCRTIFNEIQEGTFTENSHTLDHLGEQNMFHIGHSRYAPNKISHGKGCTPKMLFKVFERIGFDNLAEMVNHQMILQPMDIYLYVKDFGEDRMSDLITNVLFKELTQYTENIVSSTFPNNRPVTQEATGWGWNPVTHCWDQFTYNAPLDFNENPLGLIPKRFLTDKYRYNPQRFFQGAILEHLQRQYILENPEEKKPTKKYLKSEISKTIEGNFSKKDYIITYTMEHPRLAEVFRQNNCNGALGNNYEGYLSDNKLTELINAPYMQ